MHLALAAGDHNIPSESTSTAPPDPSSPSYARHHARPAPRTFEEFMQEVQRIAMSGAAGEDGVDGGGLMVDEDLYEELFGDEGCVAVGCGRGRLIG